MNIFLDSQHWKSPFTVAASVARPVQFGVKEKLIACTTALVASAVFAALSIPVIVYASAVSVTALCVTLAASAAAIVAVALVALYGAAAVIKSRLSCPLPNAERAMHGVTNAEIVMQGLPNIGSSCWLNSVLKFLASRTQYDAMLCRPVSSNVHDTASHIAARQLAQARLQAAITRMRAGETLTADTCHQLRASLEAIFPNCAHDAQDAHEFLEALLHHLPESDIPLISIGVALPLPANQLINLTQLFQAKEEPLEVAYPTLSVYLERMHFPNSIQLDADATCLLPIKGPDTGITEWYRYRLEATLKNTGGHWVFYERKSDGRVIEHDDARVGGKNLLDMTTSHVFRFCRVDGDQLLAN